MKTIGFLTPYRHLPEFRKTVSNYFNCLDLSDLTDKEQQQLFKECDYLFAAPNYINYTITDKMLKGTKVLKIITPSTGLNHIEAQSVGIVHIKNDPVLNNIWSTAEHNLYLMLKLPRQTNNIVELHSKNLGILGHGRLGSMVKRLARPLFNKVYVMDKNHNKPEFFKNIDFLSINIDLNKDNIKLIGRKFIKKFSKKLFIVNTSRGEVVDEKEILELLKKKQILGYATDVIQEEHTNESSILKKTRLDNLTITPHIGGTALESQEKAYNRVIEKLKYNEEI